jgi:hypothetical protein
VNIGLTGATGFIGRRIVDLALRRGHEIIAFSRTPERAVPGCTMRRFSFDAPPDLEGCEALIHLAGEPVAGVWTPKKKRRIRESRLVGTRRVVEAINASAHPPEVFLCASGTGLYADGGEAELREDAPSRSGFLPDLVREWEMEASRAQNTRIAFLRTSMVLGRKGGALTALAPLFRLGLGGPLGNGRQWMPWIHVEDEAMLALFALENLDIRGPINACAPWPVRNADFTKALSKILRRPAFFRVPAFALRMIGDFSHELLDSKRAVPAVATEHGFPFRFPELGEALKDLFG